MSESKSGSNLRQIKAWQRDVARAEYLRHPDSSIADVAKATGVAVRTVARAREALVKEGLLAPGRNNTTSGADAAVLAVAHAATQEALARGAALAEAEQHTEVSREEPAEAAITTPAPTPRGAKGVTIDGEALRQMNEMLDGLADEDDDATRKRMLRQMKRFAFDPALHPDTRMSASTLWAKLLDMQRAKDLGPGVPLTLAAAIERCTEFLRACGAKVAVPSFYAAFDLGDPDEISKAVEQGQPASTPTQPAGPSDNDPQVLPEA